MSLTVSLLRVAALLWVSLLLAIPLLRVGLLLAVGLLLPRVALLHALLAVAWLHALLLHPGPHPLLSVLRLRAVAIRVGVAIPGAVLLLLAVRRLLLAVPVRVLLAWVHVTPY